ncbi:PAAR domain-containing protein [Lysobacter koreensis]|uniref:PAAR domain-containing protein n=1 Tax=Lysobacter koreensis TaxID=266122 RepID=A0ABW2YMB1_9GAMM
MSKLWIVLGDSTSAGGVVITGSPGTDIDGKPVARIGDKATCPTHKGIFPIVTGNPCEVIDGQPVARHGDKLACGCTLIAGKQSRTFDDDGGSNKPRPRADQARAAVAAAPSGVEEFDEAFVLLSELTGKPLKNRQYKVTRANGAVENGTTDHEGKTHVVKTDKAELLTVELEEEIPA